MIIVIPAEDGGYDYPIVVHTDSNDGVEADERVRAALVAVQEENPAADWDVHDIERALEVRGFTFPAWSFSQWSWS